MYRIPLCVILSLSQSANRYPLAMLLYCACEHFWNISFSVPAKCLYLIISVKNIIPWGSLHPITFGLFSLDRYCIVHWVSNPAVNNSLWHKSINIHSVKYIDQTVYTIEALLTQQCIHQWGFWFLGQSNSDNVIKQMSRCTRRT